MAKRVLTVTRVLVSTILDSFADDCKEDEILRQYPSIKHDDIRAAISYGAELAREQETHPPRHASQRCAPRRVFIE